MGSKEYKYLKDFFDHKNGQITDVISAKSGDYWAHFSSTGPIFGLLVLRKKK